MASENTPGAYVGLLAEHDSKMLFHSKVPTLLKGQYHTNIIAGFNKSMDRIGPDWTDLFRPHDALGGRRDCKSK
jgi:hypothetical protein